MKTLRSATVIVLLAAAALSALSWGKGGGEKHGAAPVKETEAAADTGNITAGYDNWQLAVRKGYGIDFAAPEGWKFDSVSALASGGDETVTVVFEKAGGNARKVSDVAKYLFDKTLARSPKGNFRIGAEGAEMKKGTFFAMFGDLFEPTRMYDGVNDIETFWHYRYADVICRVDVRAKKGMMTVRFSRPPVKL